MSQPTLPGITHLQFLVLDALVAHDRPGRELRDALAAYGVRRSAPAFYQMMARLEDAGLVEGWYEQRNVAGQHLKERSYRLTKPGRRALDATRSFYLDRLGAARLVRKGSHA
jgi:DNA-binding PadR family transcriptional regulator